MPAAAQAELKKGNPELYSNGIEIGTGEANGLAQVGYGNIELESAQLPGGFIECTNLGLGTGYNSTSVTAPRAVGKILSWVAAGHAPGEVHKELSSECRGLGGGGWATDELHIQPVSEKEATRGAQTVPWNIEATCGTRGGEKFTIVRIGVPTTRTEAEVKAAESRACLTEAKEKTETETEVSKKREAATRPTPLRRGASR